MRSVVRAVVRRTCRAGVVLSLALGIVGIVAGGAAHAQMFGALGKPLPSTDLPNGTLSVRVINGDASQPAIGVDVTLTVAGSARAARTDSEGRALFPGVAAGASVQASVRGPDGEIKSDSFPFPDKGGVRVLLTTKPLAAEPAAGPGGGMPGGPGGMPAPRQMTGQPRPEPKDPGGMITVRVTHDDFQGKAPSHQLVYLVAYGADGTIKATTQNTDAAGRVEWKNLDVTGGTSYFALTTLRRANGTVDRMISSPMVPDPAAGIRVILSGAKLDSAEPAIDDVDNFADQTPMPPGRVHVQLDWVPNATAKVSLVDALTGEVAATATPRSPSPLAGSLTATVAGLAEDAALAPGTLVFAVTRQTARGATPVSEGTVAVRPVGGAVIADLPVVGGQVTAEKLPVGVPLEAVVAVGDERVTAGPFTLPGAPSRGARATLGVDWKARGTLEARFDGVAADRTFYVDVAMNGERYRSFPFQTVADRGVVTAVAVVPRILFKFSLSSAIEDAYFAVQGRWEVQNWAWAPYRDGPDGIVVPLPDGFSGPVVFDLKEQVATEPKGFRILRPLPPGGLRFHGGFSLKIKNGGVRWDMELPRGVFDSGIQIRQTKDMKVELPSGESGRVMRDDDGTPYYVIPNISIRPGQRMVMTLSNLPSEPAWKIWVPRLIGILVLLMIGGGLFAAFSVHRTAAAVAAVDTSRASRARIDALYDELVGLDRGGKGDASPRRAEILAELERLLAARAGGPKA
jgi:hypothetical protein